MIDAKGLEKDTCEQKTAYSSRTPYWVILKLSKNISSFISFSLSPHHLLPTHDPPPRFLKSQGLYSERWWFVSFTNLGSLQILGFNTYNKSRSIEYLKWFKYPKHLVFAVCGVEIIFYWWLNNFNPVNLIVGVTITEKGECKRLECIWCCGCVCGYGRKFP